MPFRNKPVNVLHRFRHVHTVFHLFLLSSRKSNTFIISTFIVHFVKNTNGSFIKRSVSIAASFFWYCIIEFRYRIVSDLYLLCRLILCIIEYITKTVWMTEINIIQKHNYIGGYRQTMRPSNRVFFNLTVILKH